MFISTFGSAIAWYMSKQLSYLPIFKADIIFPLFQQSLQENFVSREEYEELAQKLEVKESSLSLCDWTSLVKSDQD